MESRSKFADCFITLTRSQYVVRDALSRFSFDGCAIMFRIPNNNTGFREARQWSSVFISRCAAALESNNSIRGL